MIGIVPAIINGGVVLYGPSTAGSVGQVLVLGSGGRRLEFVDFPDAESPVTSVNGQTGEVELDASDVGAANASHTHPISDVTGLQAALDGKAATVHTHSQSDVTGLSGSLAAKADLVGGKVPSSQIPAYAISEFLGDVASQSAMLALDGDTGDWCNRTDLGKAYILTADDSSLIGSWKALDYPAAPVTSVNGATGTVVLGASDVGAPTTADFNAHTGNTSNPHSVTQSQVGLGNVTNHAQVRLSTVAAAGDLIVGSGVASVSALTVGSAGQVLQVVTGSPAWVGTPGTAVAGQPMITDSNNRVIGLDRISVGNESTTNQWVRLYYTSVTDKGLSAGPAAGPTQKVNLSTAGIIFMTGNSNIAAITGAPGVGVRSTGIFGWTATVDPSAAFQTGFSQLGAASVGLGNGSASSVSGSLSLANIVLGTALTFTTGGNIVGDTTNGVRLLSAATQKLGFWGTTPVVRGSAWTPTNVSPDRTYDANSTDINELADVVGTLIAELQTMGLLST